MTTPVQIQNSKGLKLAANLHRPEGQDEFPLVIVMNGYTSSKDRDHITTLAEALCTAGIGAIRFDASGIGDSEGTLESDYRFSNYYSDLESVYEYIKKLSWVDPTRIGVWGQSMAGMLAIIWGAKHPELKAVCSCEGPYSMNRHGKAEEQDRLTNGEHKTIWVHDWEHDKDIDRFIPPAFFKDMYQYDASISAKELIIPSLTVIGLDDELVEPADVRKIYDAIPGKKELLEVPGMTHRYRNQHEILANVNTKMVEFFQKHL